MNKRRNFFGPRTLHVGVLVVAAMLPACAGQLATATVEADGPALATPCGPSHPLCESGLFREVTQDFVVTGPGDDAIVECLWPPDPGIQKIDPNITNGLITYVLIGPISEGATAAGDCAYTFGALPEDYQPALRVVSRDEMTREAPDQLVDYVPAKPWPGD